MTFPLDPASKTTLKMKLYRHVKNVPELRQRVVVLGDLKCCIIKPSLILDPFQIVVAANKAVTAPKLKTRTVYSEILFNLSVSKSIVQSLQLFGIDDKETDMIVVTVNRYGESECDDPFNEINGDEVDINVLSEMSKQDAVKKAYKISDTESKELSLLNSVVSRIAIKDCTL